MQRPQACEATCAHAQSPLACMYCDGNSQPLSEDDLINFALKDQSSDQSSSSQPRGKREVAMADKSDPRMPTAVRHYVAPVVNPNDLPPVYSSLPAIILNMFGVMMRQKIASLFSLVFIAQSLALMKNPENDLKQIFMALTFVAMGLVTAYFGPAQKAG